MNSLCVLRAFAVKKFRKKSLWLSVVLCGEKMIDTHCHLTFPELIEQTDAVIERAAGVGVDRMITIGTSPDDAEFARSIAEHRENIWFAAGIHPHYAAEMPDDAVLRTMHLAGDARCVAVGEMGLDYHYKDPPRDVQHRWFAAQLQAYNEAGIDKPIVIHCRKAVADTLAIIAESGIDPRRFVFHCFTEPPEDCRRVLDAGCRASFTGIVTYKNAPEVRQSCRLVPDDLIMLETDSPYLSPEPHRKVRPNEPRFVADTYRFVAELRGADLDTFIAQTDANAEKFFNL